VAVVTGGGGGIGRATAVALAGAGARVTVVGRTATNVREAMQQVVAAGGECDSLVLDVTRETDMAEMAERVLGSRGRIDLLVACAGIAVASASRGRPPYPVAQLPPAHWDEVMDINLRGTFLSNRAVLPAMIEQRGGDIINLASSPGAIRGQPFAAAYCASKFAVAGLSEALGAEVAPHGVRVQVVFPDLTETALTRETTLSTRFGAPLATERVAQLILYMAALPPDTQLVSSIRTGRAVLRRHAGAR
jgi:NAD(P)-dependent dehydrogenase (short-subunit alcohol dehydrogenase family)